MGYKSFFSKIYCIKKDFSILVGGEQMCGYRAALRNVLKPMTPYCSSKQKCGGIAVESACSGEHRAASPGSGRIFMTLARLTIWRGLTELKSAE